MPEPPTPLSYGPAQRPKRFGLVIAGACLLALGGVMFFFGGIYFTSTAPPPVIFTSAIPPPHIRDWIGTVSFCGWLPTGVIGLVLLVIGLIRRSRISN